LASWYCSRRCVCHPPPPSPPHTHTHTGSLVALILAALISETMYVLVPPHPPPPTPHPPPPTPHPQSPTPHPQPPTPHPPRTLVHTGSPVAPILAALISETMCVLFEVPHDVITQKVQIQVSFSSDSCILLLICMCILLFEVPHDVIKMSRSRNRKYVS
jgi:hypothetical protein